MGLAAAGVVVVQMDCGSQTYSFVGSKNWNVSASLQGFYDDNYSTGPSKKGSFGIEFSPTITANIPLTQTEIGLLYTYGLQYYEQRDHLNVNPIDQSHTFNFWVDHAFNERWNTKINDSFNVGQEPELLQAGASGVSATPFRLNGDNIANNASIMLHTDWTRLFSTELTYGNAFYNYDQQPYAGELNRDQNTIDLDLQWHIAPETVAFIGYEFGVVNYTDGALIDPTTYIVNGKIIRYYSDSRDNLSHYGYVGLQHNFLPNLVGSARVGGQYNDQFNDPLLTSTSFDPYVDVSLIYTYLPGCNAQVGYTQQRNATDLVAVNQVNYSLTQDQESSKVYASINHRITPKLLVSAIGSWSDSTFNGGQYNNQDETDYGLGLNANYAFTRNFSGELGYNYDNLSSPDGGRAYERNRFYIGVTVAY